MNTFTNSRLITALDEGQMICQQLKIPFREVTRVKENPRLSSTWGRCKSVGRGKFEIEIKSRLLADDVSDDVLMNTMLHEILHTCEGCMNHGEIFKRYAARLNAIGWNVHTYVTEEEHKAVPEKPKTYRYKVTCENCGDEWLYTKRGPVVRALQKNSNSCTCHCGSHRLRLDNIM